MWLDQILPHQAGFATQKLSSTALSIFYLYGYDGYDYESYGTW